MQKLHETFVKKKRKAVMCIRQNSHIGVKKLRKKKKRNYAIKIIEINRSKGYRIIKFHRFE